MPCPNSSERHGRGIEEPLADQRVAVAGEWKRRQVDLAHRLAVAHHQASLPEFDLRIVADIGKTQDLAPQVPARELGRVARDIGLARGGSLAGIGGEVGVAPDQVDAGHLDPEPVGGALHHRRVGALADILGAGIEGDLAGARQPHMHRRGVGHRGVAAAIPHAADADAAPEHARGPGVEPLGLFPRRLPVRPQPFEAGGEPGARLEHLAGRRLVADANRVDVAEFERVDAAALGHLVHQHVVQQRRLRHAEAAERARGRLVGVDAGGGREHVRGRGTGRSRAPEPGPSP